MNKSNPLTADAKLRKAFEAHEREERVLNTKVGCLLVVTLMPVGSSLDYFVYPEHFWPFFHLRLWCAALAGVIWGILYTGLGKKHSKLWSIIVILLPIVFIARMIAVTEGFDSPYYAGLNLVLLAVGALMRWTFVECLMAVVLVFFIYLLAGLQHGSLVMTGTVFNNFYFIILVDVIVVVGTYFQHQQRFREFALRYELDWSRKKLEESNAKLIELDQVKSRFFANVSHELRTPLTLLLAPLETLLQQWGSTLELRARELLTTMQSNGMRLLKLINDLLDLVRLESARMEVRREPLVMEEFILGVGNAVRKTVEDRGIKLETIVDGQPGTVLADKDKLEKILLNLIFNALKFTPAGGVVQLKVGRQNEDLVFQVKDTGIGIDEKRLPFIFDRFWQADSSSQRKYQGTGIGLALVKELVEAQGGTVSVRSEVGKGTEFTVSLPYSAVDPVTATTQVESLAKPMLQQTPSAREDEWLRDLYQRADLSPFGTPVQEDLPLAETSERDGRPRVLIVDDEPAMLRFLRSQLGGQFQLLEAADGQEAIESARQFLPDVVLCDMMMPVKDGVEVCRELRKCAPTRNIPVVLLTAWAAEETKLQALAAGTSDFVTKPFSTTELNIRLKNLIEAYHLQREIAHQNQILDRALEATLAQLKKTESQLLHSEKLASLGRMSAGIIHEINSPLNFAKTGLSTLENLGRSLDDREKADFGEIIRDVQEGLDRIKSIVTELRTFIRSDVAQREEVPVVGLVGSALRLLRNEWKNKVRIEQHIPEEMAIWANKNQIIQVIINLLQNAMDALKKKKFPEAEPTVWIKGHRKDNENGIVIRDNGEGISPENLGRIFDPFFTTKEIGEGMGLGLSLCNRIMEQHGGRIGVKSEEGQYSEFVLLFPTNNQNAKRKDKSLRFSNGQ